MQDKIFIVTVTDKNTNKCHVNSEGWTSFASAEKFILSRSDNPQLFTSWVYETECLWYSIHEVKVQ